MNRLGNLPFMPAKNDLQDRQNILKMSKEFNPLISLRVGAPSSGVSQNSSAHR